MTTKDPVTLYYSPRTRATGVRILLEELGAPYDLHVLDIKKGEQRRPDYLAVNPLGKVPAIRHGESIVTEQSAIYIYLSDAFPEAGLTPAIGDPDRAAFLRWIVFYSSCFEPALIDRSMGREPPPQSRSAYGDYESVLGAIEGQLAKGPYMAGERFTTADLLWGVALHWTTSFNLVPGRPAFTDYFERIVSRPAFVKVWKDDQSMADEQERHADSPG
jgi:glutathione S-transferase